MLGELALKARMTTETLNAIDGVQCNEVMGAMYAFPRVFLPDKAVAEAKVLHCFVISHLLLQPLVYNACFRTNKTLICNIHAVTGLLNMVTY